MKMQSKVKNRKINIFKMNSYRESYGEPYINAQMTPNREPLE